MKSVIDIAMTNLLNVLLIATMIPAAYPNVQEKKYHVFKVLFEPGLSCWDKQSPRIIFQYKFRMSMRRKLFEWL